MRPRYLVSGSIRLDLSDARLWLGDAPVVLRAKPFEFLRVLMENAQRLVTKEELLEQVWPGVTVSEAVITSAVRDVRRALGDDARRPHLIETAHGRGYRFLAAVEATDEAPATNERPLPTPPSHAADTSPRPVASSRLRPLTLSLILGALVIAGAVSAGLVWWGRYTPTPQKVAEATKSVAVMPFTDLSAVMDQEWFADGLTEEVLNGLARTPDLRVVSRRSAAKFGDGGREAIDAARELGVAHLLQGSVRHERGRRRVSVTLVRTSDGALVWSKTYDRGDEDSMSIQADIAFDIASALRTVLEPEKLRAMVGAGTRSVEAYEAYLQGLALEQRELENGDVALTRQASEAFEKARALDPNFSDAHWRAARIWFGNATRINAAARGDVPPEERLRLFLERIQMAIDTSRDETERLKYQASQASMQMRIRAAHRAMAAYLERRPRDLDAWEEMADLAAYAGEPDWVIRAAERMHTLSLQDGLPRSRAVTVAVMAQRYDEATRWARAQMATQPENAMLRYQAHRAMIGAGRAYEARQLLTAIEGSDMPMANRLLSAVRQACAEGRPDEARRIAGGLGPTSPLATRWQAAQTLGDLRGAEEILRPHDTARGLPLLMQFLIYPSFDPRPFPMLSARLAQEGVERPPAAPIPHGCAPL
jgi:TolB-like protein/DNA-binding winged helix-turn-helix (wHTH) protein/DNA-binding SARP family transcriptional activator